MKVIEQELKALREELNAMWILVSQQLYNAGEALLSNDKVLANKVICRERRVNAYELKIDSDCEDIIALYAPVAIDLRFVLAILKINTSLERLGDFAEGIARTVVRLPGENLIDEELLKKTRVDILLKEVLKMLSTAKEALNKENSELASRVFVMDNLVDTINHESIEIVATYIKEHPDKILDALYLQTIIRKLERFGDHCTNIAEEIIFFLDAKVVKHAMKEEKDKKFSNEINPNE